MPRLSSPPALYRRQLSNSSGSSSLVILLAVGSIVIVIILLLILAHFVRKQRLAQIDPPRWVPSFLHRRWRAWRPTASKTAARSQSLASSSLRYTPSSSGPGSSGHGVEVDRRQSVRSILTLPPYNVAPLPSERLIAREGERAGVDTVIDLPEAEEELEARREEEMHALFLVREARRREVAEREDRREQRRTARENQDWERLEQLEAESRARARLRASDEHRATEEQRSRDEANLLSSLTASQQPSSQFLIAELQSVRELNARSRRVSSVSYAELGLARHDGSRLRGDSVESSDHRPLLDSAASFGNRSRAVSRAGSDNGGGTGGVPGAGGHGRSLSVASLAPSGGGGGDRSRAASTTRSPLGHGRHISEGAASMASDESGNNGSRPNLLLLLTPQSSADLPPHPPSYEDDASVHGGDAPPYESPLMERNPQFGGGLTGAAATRGDAVEQPDQDLASAAGAAEAFVLAQDESARSRQGQNRPAPDMPVVDPPSASVSPTASFRSALGSPAAASPTLARLQISRGAPALQVTSATPVRSEPPTPIGGRD